MEGRRSWEGVPLGESHSPPQSVPGRRTPLGAVGLGGFYMQGGQPPPPQHCYPTDENQPEPGTSYGPRLVRHCPFFIDIRIPIRNNDKITKKN